MRFVRIRDAAQQLGYERSYAWQIVPRMMPVYRAPGGGDNSPLVVKREDLDALVAKMLAEPVKAPA